MNDPAPRFGLRMVPRFLNDEERRAWYEAQSRELEEDSRARWAPYDPPEHGASHELIVKSLWEIRDRLDVLLREREAEHLPVRGITRDQVASALGIDARSLDHLVREAADAGIAPPCVDVGSGTRRREVWDVNQIQPWFREVARWQASARGTTATRSAGENARATAGPGGAARAGPSRPRASSSDGSSAPSTCTDTGSSPRGPSPLKTARTLISDS